MNSIISLFQILLLLFRIFSIVLSFCSFSWATCSIKNRGKNGAVEGKVLAVMIAKILCDSCGRLIVFSTCLYYLGSGNFSTLYTLLWFYSMVAALIIFYSIFNEDHIFSIENIMGDDTIF